MSGWQFVSAPYRWLPASRCPKKKRGGNPVPVPRSLHCYSWRCCHEPTGKIKCLAWFVDSLIFLPFIVGTCLHLIITEFYFSYHTCFINVSFCVVIRIINTQLSKKAENFSCFIFGDIIKSLYVSVSNFAFVMMFVLSFLVVNIPKQDGGHG